MEWRNEVSEWNEERQVEWGECVLSSYLTLFVHFILPFASCSSFIHALPSLACNERNKKGTESTNLNRYKWKKERRKWDKRKNTMEWNEAWFLPFAHFVLLSPLVHCWLVLCSVLCSLSFSSRLISLPL